MPDCCTINREAVASFSHSALKMILPRMFDGRFFLAGGCFKTLLHGQPPNDLDLWPASDDDRLRLLHELEAQGSKLESDTDDFNTVLRHGSTRIEVTK